MKKVHPLAVQAGDYLLEFNGRTHLMGILNVTPDSFSDGGMFFDKKTAVEHGIRLAGEGADIIDVGGESTRPRAEPVPLEEELKRVIPVIRELAGEVDVPISIDTYKSEVAKEAIEAGASIINDISGLRFDDRMAGLAAETGVALVVMHIKGTPRDMQVDPHYDDLLKEIGDYLSRSIEIAVEAGVKKENVIIDPGIGFGKRIEDNFILIKNLEYFRALGQPLLIGPSRKSFLWKTLNVSTDETLEATAAATAASVLSGADLIRAHDVKEISKAIKIADLIAAAPEMN
ncbi:MAG: dihydropteroate synthase [Candidatus Marinimicrobia bacterium]|nr:dihydropteroate synthase [Candidatus Neomarinimicrobiota bacterium]